MLNKLIEYNNTNSALSIVLKWQTQYRDDEMRIICQKASGEFYYKNQSDLKISYGLKNKNILFVTLSHLHFLDSNLWTDHSNCACTAKNHFIFLGWNRFMLAIQTDNSTIDWNVPTNIAVK